MTITLATLRARRKVWGATVTLGGQPFTIVDRLPTRTLGLRQNRSVCTVQVAEPPFVEAGTDAVVTVTLNGQSAAFFTGRVGTRPLVDHPRAYEVNLVDRQSLLEVPLPDELIWTGRSVPDAALDLFAAAGLSPGDVAGIDDPGPAYTLGAVEAVIIPAGSVVMDVLRTLMAYAGLSLITTPNGQFRLRYAPHQPQAVVGAPVYAYDPSGDELIIEGARRTIGGFEGGTARFVARGPKLGSGALPEAAFTLTGVVGKTVEQQHAWIQTDEAALAYATREIIRANLSATEVQVSAPFNPLLLPGDAVWFRNPELGITETTRAQVISITSDDSGGMTMLLHVGLVPENGEAAYIPAPHADFSMRFEVQPITLGSELGTGYVVEATDASSDPSDFAIVSRTWTAACGGGVSPSPTSATDELTPIFVFPTLEGATISLAIEAESGEGDRRTKPVAPSEQQLFTRILSVAAGDAGWRVLGRFGWREFVIDGVACTAVPPINDTGPLIAGFANGELYRTDDGLEEDPELIHAFGGAITKLWVNEGSPTHWLAAVGPELHRSTNSGETWALLHTFSSPIADVQSNPDNSNEIRVCAGTDLWISYDAASFAVHVAGPTGSICRGVASAPWGHLVVWEAEWLRWEFEEGYLVDWSDIPEEERPTSLGAVTAMQHREGFIVATPPAAGLIRDGLFGELSYLAAPEGETQLYAFEQVEYEENPDPEGLPHRAFKARAITSASRGGALKVVSHAGSYGIDTPSSALAIGYGQTVSPFQPPQLLLLPFEETGAKDVLWVYDVEQQDWQTVVLPVSQAAWAGCAISPTHPKSWLIWTNGWQAFTTDNAGQHWVQIYLPDAGLWRDYGGIRAAVYTRKREWLLSAFYFYAAGTGRWGQAYYARGEGGAIRQVWSNGTRATVAPGPSGPFALLRTLVRGVNGEVFGHATTQINSYPEFGVPPPDTMAWIGGEATSVTLGPQDPYRLDTTTKPDTRAAYGAWAANIAHTPDYRSVAPTAIIAAGGSVAVCEVGVVVGDRDGVAVINGITTPSPTVTVVAGGERAVGPIRAGSRGRGAAAIEMTAPEGQKRIIHAYNGLTWVSFPVPEASGTLCPILGVIER